MDPASINPDPANQNQDNDLLMPQQPPITPQPEPALSVAAPTPPPPPPAPVGADIIPQPIVKVLSPRGVEYVFLIIALISGAFSLGAILISLINGQYGFSALAFSIAGLIVSVPVFALLFLRLKKAELNDPQAKLDASKRRSTQFTQILSFLVSFFTLIGLVTTILFKIGGDYKGSIIKVILDVLVVEVIAGGILFYYWRDEHLKGK